VMQEMHVSGGEAVVRLLEEANAGAILRFGVEADVVKFLQDPVTAIACDCGATTATRTHPRMYGTFPRVLGHYVRETHALTWENAIRKMTGLPASTIGLVDRGFLAPGMAADITVFDPKTVIDHSTYEEPTKLSEGILYVLVNGRVELKAGMATGVQGGRVLTRSPHMPSRPMSASLARRVSAQGTVDGQLVSISLAQAAAARRATGTFRLVDPQSHTTIEATSLGELQTSPGWASFTAQARITPSGDEHAVTVILERADPFEDGRPPTVTVLVDGAERVGGALSGAALRILSRGLQ